VKVGCKIANFLPGGTAKKVFTVFWDVLDFDVSNSVENSPAVDVVFDASPPTFALPAANGDSAASSTLAEKATPISELVSFVLEVTLELEEVIPVLIS
jgi:hypothetical protein